MSYSLLQVSYKNEKTPAAIVDCEDEAAERRKIAETKAKPQAVTLAVYRCQRIVTLQEVWVEVPYAPPVKEEPAP